MFHNSIMIGFLSPMNNFQGLCWFQGEYACSLLFCEVFDCTCGFCLIFRKRLCPCHWEAQWYQVDWKKVVCTQFLAGILYLIVCNRNSASSFEGPDCDSSPRGSKGSQSCRFPVAICWLTQHPCVALQRRRWCGTEPWSGFWVVGRWCCCCWRYEMHEKNRHCKR